MASEVEVTYNLSVKLPNPAFDLELQAIAHIEYILNQFDVGTKLRVLRFVEDRINSKE